MEEYKICFEDYEISNFGNCRRKLINGKYKIIKGSLNNRGYRYFQVVRNNKRLNKLFHQMVAFSFLGDRPEKYDIDHIDRNKLNNNVNNLRYITHKDNSKNHHRYRDDILETDIIKRRNILEKERRYKKRRDIGIKEINSKGEGNIFKRKDTKQEKYIGQIKWNGVKYSKTFNTELDAQNFINTVKINNPIIL
jgi:hypothetical protein